MKLWPFHACYTVLRSLYLAAPMRQMVVPQSGHLPFVMGLPFFVVPSTGSCMTSVSYTHLFAAQGSLSFEDVFRFTHGGNLLQGNLLQN